MTESRIAKFDSMDEGTWYFHVAAVDNAGNVGNTAHYTIRLKPMVMKEDQTQIVLNRSQTSAPSRDILKTRPILKIVLLLVVAGNFFLIVFITTKIILKQLVKRQSVQPGKK